jgi:hypothetical protein
MFAGHRRGARQREMACQLWFARRLTIDIGILAILMRLAAKVERVDRRPPAPVPPEGREPLALFPT